ncbi:hypothetical protein CSAL01_08875 [Colletotrichum salicis]|uniref:Uncharacterized protein n=1 Tax=Colletotrichum salicis TaxID=1209931 RepID=A0A135ULH4_9PEZI|nr:hypothetical protein CSAL01_08875 [Colletotrichum salicis]
MNRKLERREEALIPQARKAALYQNWVLAKIAQRVADSPILQPPPLDMGYGRQGTGTAQPFLAVLHYLRVCFHEITSEWDKLFQEVVLAKSPQSRARAFVTAPIYRAAQLLPALTRMRL